MIDLGISWRSRERSEWELAGRARRFQRGVEGERSALPGLAARAPSGRALASFEFARTARASEVFSLALTRERTRNPPPR